MIYILLIALASIESMIPYRIPRSYEYLLLIGDSLDHWVIGVVNFTVVKRFQQGPMTILVKNE